MFWDKLERANYFLEAIIETGGPRRSTTARSPSCSSGRSDDGGQWNMFVNLVNKHGLVPKAFMPETESSSNTRRMNAMLRSKLREGAQALRDMHAAGASIDELRATKQDVPGGRSTASSASTSARRRSASSGSGTTRTASSTATTR